MDDALLTNKIRERVSKKLNFNTCTYLNPANNSYFASV